jgi:hypothetical protein
LRKNRKILIYLVIFAVLGFGALFGGFYFKSFEKIYSEPTKSVTSVQPLTTNDSSGNTAVQKVVFKIDSPGDIDKKVEDYLRNLYPIISDKVIEEIEATKWINKFLLNDSLGIVDLYANFYVPKNYLAEHPKILWELNIAAFESHIYQIYNGDTILIDTWPNVIGKPSTKTYTGHYEAFRLRNWPFWKDPEAPDSVKATPPGPDNPLGLFVVHYDENSLRYFHGTNKNYLLKKEYRALSHGCVRNLNENIAKMKKFIINKIVVSEDLSYWLKSTSTMTFEMKEEDRFPVRIIYKTFDIKNDDYGDYIIFYKDVYNYEKGASLSEFDDPALITYTNLNNILAEFKLRHSALQIPDAKIIPIIDNLLENHTDYQKYYFDDLVREQSQNN